jgi:hypothetical protein
LATVALNQELAAFMPPAGRQRSSSLSDGEGGSGSPMRTRSGPAGAVRHSSVFAPSTEERMRPVRTPPGPPPGAYDVQPKWNKVGTHVMAPQSVVVKKKEDTRPG